MRINKKYTLAIFILFILAEAFDLMGAKDSKAKLSSLDETPKVNHPRFVNPRFLKEKNGDNAIEISLPVASKI